MPLFVLMRERFNVIPSIKISPCKGSEYRTCACLDTRKCKKGQLRKVSGCGTCACLDTSRLGCASPRQAHVLHNEKKSTKAERLRGSALSRSHTPSQARRRAFWWTFFFLSFFTVKYVPLATRSEVALFFCNTVRREAAILSKCPVIT